MVENLFENIYEIEYPCHQDIFSGIGINQGFEYISSTYCNGIVNYIHEPQIVLLKRYGDIFEESCQHFLSQSEKEWFNTNLGLYEDDMLVFGLDDNCNPKSYILIWFDNDVSDCSVWRFDKFDFYSMEHFIELMKKWLDSNDLIEAYLFPERKPVGWMKF